MNIKAFQTLCLAEQLGVHLAVSERGELIVRANVAHKQMLHPLLLEFGADVIRLLRARSEVQAQIAIAKARTKGGGKGKGNGDGVGNSKAKPK